MRQSAIGVAQYLVFTGVGTVLLAFIPKVQGSDSQVTAGLGSVESCRNPLFRPLWKGSTRATLNTVPEFHIDLQLCLSYNQHPSCCNTVVEIDALKPQFEAWRTWLGGTIQAVDHVEHKLGEYQESNPVEFHSAGHEELKRYHSVARAFAEMKAEAPRCFRVLLQYIAGMVCFACRPDWPSLGTTASGVGRLPFVVRVQAYEGAVLWAQCETFGLKASAALQVLDDARNLVTLAVSEAALSTLSNKLEMFLSVDNLRRGVFISVAMHPLFGAAQEGKEADLRALADTHSANDADNAFTPVGEGRLAGFNCEWSSGEDDDQDRLQQPISDASMEEKDTAGPLSGDQQGPQPQHWMRMPPWVLVFIVLMVPIAYIALQCRRESDADPPWDGHSREFAHNGKTDGNASESEEAFLLAGSE